MLELSEQAGRVTCWRRERRWGVEELKGCQQQKEGKLQIHSCLMFTECYVHTFESLQGEGLYLGALLYWIRCPREVVRSWWARASLWGHFVRDYGPQTCDTDPYPEGCCEHVTASGDREPTTTREPCGLPNGWQVPWGGVHLTQWVRH